MINKRNNAINSNNQMQNILKLLEKGEKTVKAIGEHKNIVLVLGITGSGKSTFTQFIAGYDHELESLETGLGDYQIVDKKNKIGNSTITSQTIFPDLVIDTETSIAFYDCPGFQETRSVAHEISGTYFIKKIIDNASNIKLVFTVGFPSVRDGMDRHGFPLLLENAVKLIKNIEKFKNSIALIVTKVDRLTKSGVDEDEDGEPIQIPFTDEDYIDSVAKFIANVKKDLSKDDEDFDKKVQFIDVLLSKTGEEYKNIGIFRKPNRIGVLSELKVLSRRKPILRKIVFDNVKFTAIEDSDFGYTLSADAENEVDDLIEKINDNIGLHMKIIGQEIKKYYQNQENNLNDIHDLRNMAQSGYNSFKIIQDLDDPFIEAQELMTKIYESINSLQIKIAKTNFSQINNYIEYIQFLKAVSDDIIKPNASHLARKFEDLVNYLNGSRQWYLFLIQFNNILSDYEIQKNIRKYETEINELKDSIIVNKKAIYKNRKYITDKIELLLKEMGRNYINSIAEEPYDMPIDETKLMFLTKVLNSALSSSKEKPLCSDGKLVIQGKDVKLSDIFKSECPQSKSIEIFATNNVFIDTDLSRIGKEQQLSIIAPTWKVIGQPKIILDGKPAKVHEDKVAPKVIGGPGTNGNDGKAGNPGGPAGSFLGIGQRFIDGENLSISLKGGNGGPGQNGSDGLKARNGDIMGDPTDEEYRFPNFEENCHLIDRNTEVRENVMLILQYYNCYINGRKCTTGGKGGRGGEGGKGGKSTQGKLFTLKTKRRTNVKLDSSEGKIGIKGQDGHDHEDGKLGQSMTLDLEVQTLHYITSNNVVIRKVTNINKINHTDCEQGINTATDIVNIKYPVKPDVINVPAVINEYKSYLRESLHNNIREKSLRKFLNHLEKDVDIKNEFNTLGFINELQVLEEQFYKLRKQLPFLPFYKSLLSRIGEYVNELQKNKELTEDDKKILNYLYAATLSKIISINDRTTKQLVLDPQKYFELESKNIEILKELRSNTLKDDLHKNYNESIKKKIDEVQAFINTKITPEFNKIMQQQDTQIQALIRDMESREAAVKEEKNKLIEQEKELKDQIIIKKVLHTVQVASKFLNFAGPIGAAVGEGINTGVGVIEALALKDSESTVTEKLIELPAAVNDSFSTIREELEKQNNLLKNQLTDVENQLKEDSQKPQSEIDSHLKEISDKISKLKEEVIKETDLVATYENISEKRKELANLLKEKSCLLEKQETPSNSENIQKWIKRLDRANTIINMVQLSIDLYKTIQKDAKKIDKISDAIKQADVKLKLLEKYEENIYRIIIPKCAFINNQINNVSDNLKGKSQVALDVSKWDMQSSLKDVRHQIRQLTKEFPVQENIVHFMEKLEEAISVMMNMYELIQDYHDKVELVDYITNINSDQAMQHRISDDKLRNAVGHLKLILQSNLVLEKYEKGMDSFRQYIYPFAKYYLAKFESPFKNQPNEIDALVSDAAEAMITLKDDIAKSKIEMDQFDHCILNQHFTLEDNNPFYVWNHDQNKFAISSLLNGEEITLKSDITNGLTNMNAVKFKKVGIRFAIKLTNVTMQQEMNEKLKDFHINMVHLGNSQYRCIDKFHTIRHDNVTINYSLGGVEQDTSRKYNVVYGKLSNNEPLLSPYTMWIIQLTSTRSNFDSLKEYRNLPIDLVLEGIGKYVDNGIVVPSCNLKQVCNDDLNEYYKTDDSIIEGTDTIPSKKKHSKDNLDSKSLRKKKQNLQRKRRSLSKNEQTQNTHTNSYATNGAYSSMKSSFINNIFNAVGAGLVAFEYLNPVNKISQWFTKNENFIDQEDFNVFDNNILHSSSKFLNIESYNSEVIEVSNLFIRDETAKVDTVLYDSSICNHGNLLLLDLILRSKSGVKHEQERLGVSKNLDYEYAQNLAYRKHIGSLINEGNEKL